jgi:hypothetical protein
VKPLKTNVISKDQIQIIYCFTNPEKKAKIEGYERVKIGKTDNIPRRLKELFSTGVSESFEVYRALVVPNMDETETYIHKMLSKYRANPRREFFDVPLDMIDNLFDLLLTFSEVEEYTYEDKEEFEPKTDVTLYHIGLRDGNIMQISGNNDYIEDVKVVNAKENLILYDGKPQSLSSAANNIAIKSGGSGKRSGWKVGFWNGKSLVEHRAEYFYAIIRV